MHAPACVDVVQWLDGGYATSMKYLRYFCKLFTLLKNRTAICGMRPTHGAGCWTGSLTYMCGQF
jgi:hypothetical protein